jgi:hypothetical protein
MTLRFDTAGGYYTANGAIYLNSGGALQWQIFGGLMTEGANTTQIFPANPGYSDSYAPGQPITINLSGLNPSAGGRLFYNINYTQDVTGPV